jgi:hypothetical protein
VYVTVATDCIEKAKYGKTSGTIFHDSTDGNIILFSEKVNAGRIYLHALNVISPVAGMP